MHDQTSAPASRGRRRWRRALLGAAVAAAGVAMAPSTPTAGAAQPADLLGCRFGASQVFDVQYNYTGTTPGVDKVLNVSGAARPYASANPSGQLQAGDLAAGDYYAFVPSTTVNGTYALKLYDSSNQVKRTLHDTGSFSSLGSGFVFYLGGGSYGTFFATTAAIELGAGGSYPVSDDSVTDVEALAFNSCSDTPIGLQVTERYTPVTPTRLLDTRQSTAMAPMVERQLVVTGANGVAANATAVNVNVTVTDTSADGWVAAYPCGTERTNSTVNFVAGHTTANMASVQVGTGGAICLVSTVASHVVVDLNGWFGESAANGYSSGASTRLVDTRENATRLTAGVPRSIAVPQQFGVQANDPQLQVAVASNPVAALLNVTATNPAAAGYLAVYACSEGVPMASNVNFAAGETTANAAIGMVDGSGNVCVVSSVDTDLVVDLFGVFRQGAAEFVSRSPIRVVDTRQSTMLAAGATLQVPVASALANNAGGAVFNLTVTGSDGPGYLTVHTCGSSVPWVSNLNFSANETVANFAVGQLNGGNLCIYSTTNAHVIVDVAASILNVT
ncbi:MAG: hypothetical protein AB7W59_16595 [Acidimicrobiia bacterium]